MQAEPFRTHSELVGVNQDDSMGRRELVLESSRQTSSGSRLDGKRREEGRCELDATIWERDRGSETRRKDSQLPQSRCS